MKEKSEGPGIEAKLALISSYNIPYSWIFSRSKYFAISCPSVAENNSVGSLQWLVSNTTAGTTAGYVTDAINNEQIKLALAKCLEQMLLRSQSSY